MSSITPADAYPSDLSWNILENLPVEIWEQVFFYALPPASHFISIGFNATEFNEYDPKVVLGLSQISRYLRIIVISCPNLWTCIPSLEDISRRESAKGAVYFENRFKLVELFMERSQSLPVRVTFIDKVFSPDDLSEELAGCNRDARDGVVAFFPKSYRWKSITIYFALEDTLERFANALVSFIHSTPILPILDTLHIRHNKWNMTWLPTPISVLLKAPKLQHIRFIGMDIDILFDIPWNQLISYSGAVQKFDQLRGAADTVKELILMRNLQFFENPQSGIHFSKLETLKVDNVNFLHKIPRHYPDWRADGTVLRWTEAPCLHSLEITTYQALQQAPSIIGDLTMRMLRFPHDNLRHITFHVGGLTRQSLADLLHSTPYLESLDLWGVQTEPLSALIITDSILALVPKLRTLVIREWQDAGPQTLLEMFESRRPYARSAAGACSLERIDLVYKKYDDCRKAQDVIEGWAEERLKVFKAGSEYQKVHGYSHHLAKVFLIKDSTRNPACYGIRRPRRGDFCKDNSDPQMFLDVVEKHEYSDSRFVEMTRLRPVLQDIRDQIGDLYPDPELLQLPGTIYAQTIPKLGETAHILLRKWEAVLNEGGLRESGVRRWKMMDDRLTLRLES